MRRLDSTFAAWGMRRGIVAALAAFALWGLPFRALAQSARELNDKGMQALSAARYDEAVQALDAAYRKEPKPGVLYNLGLAYKGAGHPDRALEAFESCIKYADPKKDAKTIQAVRAEIDRIKGGYARYTLKLTPPEATIDIDGAAAQAAKGELWVQSGKHKISVRSDGYERYEQSLEVAPGHFDLEIHLREITGPPEARAAALLEEGIALQGSGNIDGAIDKFEAAEGIYPTGHAEALMGLAEETVSELPEAYKHLDLALKKPKDAYVKKNKKKIKAARDRIKGQLATLNITGTPFAAEVFVNGKSVGTLPLQGPVPVMAGSITVNAKKSGYSEFEQLLDLPKRSTRTVKIEMSEAPALVAAPVPLPKPEPKFEPPPDEPVPALQPLTEPPKSTQADIEAGTEAQPPQPPEELGPKPSATGFEAAFNFGYQPWIGGPKTDGSKGAWTPQIVLGARPIWPLSLGVELNFGFDLATSGTSFILNPSPGFYVRGHTQQHQEPMTFDGWAGVGLHPFAFQIVELKANSSVNSATNPNAVDPNSAEARLLRANAGVDRGHTVQSINIPFELGASFFFTESIGIDLSAALTLWLPQQSCIHSPDERLCTSSGLKTQTSLLIGAGLTILP